MCGQAQSSLGHFKLAPPSLAASEAIRRPGLGQMNGKVKRGPGSLRPLRRGLECGGGREGRTGRRELGAEAPPFIPALHRPGRDESRLAGCAVHLPVGEGLGPLWEKTAVPARPGFGLGRVLEPWVCRVWPPGPRLAFPDVWKEPCASASTSPGLTAHR